MNRVREVQRLNETELESGVAGTSASWHYDYRDSPYVYTGGLPNEMNEGDVMVVFSQYGQIRHLHLARDKDTGKSLGFAFVAYVDQRSTELAVDNLNGIVLVGRTISVDHCRKFRLPKELVDKIEAGELAQTATGALQQVNSGDGEGGDGESGAGTGADRATSKEARRAARRKRKLEREEKHEARRRRRAADESLAAEARLAERLREVEARAAELASGRKRSVGRLDESAAGASVGWQGR